MEFLRFGSSIPGGYWGCCAMDIIQNFKVDPDTKASIELVDGDGGSPISGSKGVLFAGPTYKDIFLQRLRIGTFSSRDMPNHGFLAILTHSQVSGGVGKKWLKILKEQGFEFIRTVDNSVYSGESIIKEAGSGCTSAHPNYLFGLFRNVGAGAIKDPYTPPVAWMELPSVKPEAWQRVTDGVSGEEFNKEVQKVDLELYKKLPQNAWLSEAELREKGVTVTTAGRRKSGAAPATKYEKKVQSSDPFASQAAQMNPEKIAV